MAERALSPVIGVVLLLAITITLAGVVGLTLISLQPNDAPIQASISADVNLTTDTFRFVHDGGDPIDVHTLEVTIFVDDEPIRHQPRVPYFSQTGFQSGPTGPFNRESNNVWKAGESASLALACSNEPKPADATIIEIHFTSDGNPIDTVKILVD